MAWVVGNAVRVDGSFRTDAGALFDPEEPVLKIRNARTGTLVTPELETDGTGLYYGTFVPTEYGRWMPRWSSGGTNPIVNEGPVIIILPSQVER